MSRLPENVLGIVLHGNFLIHYFVFYTYVLPLTMNHYLIIASSKAANNNIKQKSHLFLKEKQQKSNEKRKVDRPKKR